MRPAAGAVFETEAQVAAYAEATAGLDARVEVTRLHELLGDGARVLELGSGCGVDLLRLARSFRVVGSDPSAAARQWIRRRYGSETPPLLDLRAQDLALARAGRLLGRTIASSSAVVLDGIFSSKVLHLLDPAEHRRCVAAQASRLAPDGVALHVYWAPSPEARRDALATAGGDHTDRLRQHWLAHFGDVEISPRSELAHHDLVAVLARRPVQRRGG